MTAFGFPRHHYRRTDSTNARARELAEAGISGGAVVTAGEQTAGRGRHGRTWTAPADKALLASFVLRPLDEAHRLLPLAAPLAVCEAIEAVGPAECRVKWPNDVWIDGRKAAGVLIEARHAEWAVIGIGINVAIAPDEFPPELRDTATSIPGGETEGLLTELATCLTKWAAATPEVVVDAFRSRDGLRGRAIGWEAAGGAGSGSGTADGIADDGNLLVLTDEGERLSLGAGEVSLRLG